MRRIVALLAAVLFCAVVVPKRVSATAAADTTFAGDWGQQGKLLFGRPTSTSPSFSPDLDGGFFLKWSTGGPGPDTAWVTRFTSEGEIAPGWTEAGVRVCEDARQYDVQMMPDPSGGVHCSWIDSRSGEPRLYLQHLLGTGQRDPSWPPCGRMVPLTSTITTHILKPDGVGGFVLLWYGPTPADRTQIRVVRLDGEAGIQPAWPDSGVRLTLLGPNTSYSTESASPTDVYPGAAGEVIAQYQWKRGCSGHGCQYFTHPELVRVGPTGIVARAFMSSEMQWRQIAPDAHGGAYSMFSWSPDRIIEHLWAPVPLQLSMPAAAGITNDGADGMVIQNGATLVRIAYDGTPNAGWGGMGGRSVGLFAWPTLARRWVPDGERGFYFVWADYRRNLALNAGGDIYATVVKEDGSIAPGWLETGLPVLTRRPYFAFHEFIPLAMRRALVLWLECESDGACRWRIHGQRLSVDQPVPTQVSLVSAIAHADRIALEWFAADDEGAALTVERTDHGSEWRAIASVYADGTGHIEYEDRDVRAGVQYGYRLRDSQREFAETWVTVPLAAKFGIRSAVASAAARVRVEFSAAAGADTEVALFDLVGRRITRSRVVASGEATQSVELDAPNELAPGLYLVRVTSADQHAQRRLMITR